MESNSVIANYINDAHWKVNENSNAGFSIQGLNLNLTTWCTKNYWRKEVYTKEITKMHEKHDIPNVTSNHRAFHILR